MFNGCLFCVFLACLTFDLFWCLLFSFGFVCVLLGFGLFVFDFVLWLIWFVLVWLAVLGLGLNVWLLRFGVTVCGFRIFMFVGFVYFNLWMFCYYFGCCEFSLVFVTLSCCLLLVLLCGFDFGLGFDWRWFAGVVLTDVYFGYRWIVYYGFVFEVLFSVCVL